jgi:AcrR family transcriptional regulator
MLSTRSLDKVAIDDIAAEAGISRGLLFHYFPTKHAFYVAVVQAAADRLYERTEPDPDLPLLDQLRSGTDAYVDYVTENREAYVALVRGAAGADEALQAVFDRSRAQMAARVLRGLGVAGPAPPRLWLAARGWAAFTEQVVVDWLTAGALDVDRDAVVTLVDEALVAVVRLAVEQSGIELVLPTD